MNCSAFCLHKYYAGSGAAIRVTSIIDAHPVCYYINKRLTIEQGLRNGNDNAGHSTLKIHQQVRMRLYFVDPIFSCFLLLLLPCPLLTTYRSVTPSMTTRQVVVDDTDPRVKYTGTWALDQGSQDSFGIYGPEYNHTLHGTSANNAGIAFSFNGKLYPPVYLTLTDLHFHFLNTCY